MHKDLASVESLGAVSLDDDAEAAAFAASVIRDIKAGAHGRYDGCTFKASAALKRPLSR